MYAGIGATGNFITNREYNFDGHMHYTQVIPQTIKVNDTIMANITGFNFAATAIGFDVFKKLRSVDLFLSAGFNTGRLRLYGNSFVNQKNPYFSPKVSLTPRFTFGRISIQMNIDYGLDISKKNWRKTNLSNSPKLSLPQTSMTGLSTFVMLGFVFD